MPGSTYSTNLKVELMATGENSGTWGDITNTNLGTALEQAIVGYGNPNYSSDANLTISITNSNAAQAARALVLNVTSSVSLTATRELVVPTIQKQYIVQNNTTGSQSITVKTSAGTGITVPNGRKAHLYVDGTNVIQMFDFVDINGGAIDGTPIGASSASTGAFTTLNASGATTLDGNVTLGNASGDNVTVTGTITSNLLFTDNTYDIGANGATRPRNLYLAGAATIGGNLSVGGTLTLTGGLTLNGNVTVGDSSSDTLTINSTITSNLLFTDNTYDIGASGATRPRNLFLAGNATVGGNQTLTGSLTVDSTTDSSSTITGSIQTDGGLGVAKALYVGTNVNIGGLTASKGVFTDANKTLTSSGTLLTDQGGTGLSSFTAGDLVYYATGTAFTKLGIGTNGQILTSTGTAPQWSTLSGVAVTTFSAGTTGLTPSSATSGAVTLAGTLNVANGGTGLTSLANGRIPFGAGTSAFGNAANFNYDSANVRLGVGATSPPTTFSAGGATSTTLGFSIAPGGWNNALHRLTVPISGDNSVWSFNWNGAAVDFSGYATSSITIGQGNVYIAVGPTNTAPSNVAAFSTNLLAVTGAVTSTLDATIYGVTVGRGAGAVATNTAVGASALGSHTSGAFNVAVGANAAANATSFANATVVGMNAIGTGIATGTYITAIGTSALQKLTSGSYVTGVGVLALKENTSGNYNTALGVEALQANTTASSNTAVGYQAAYSNQTGANNTIIGQGAGSSGTASSNNTFVGQYAGGLVGYGPLTGGGNTCIGAASGINLTSGAYNTFVGPQGQVNQGSGGVITSGSRNTIIGAYNGNQGGLDIRTASNYVVLSDGDGNPRMYANAAAWTNPGSMNVGGMTTYAQYSQSFSLGTTQWIRLCQLGNPGTMRIKYFLGSSNSEEYGEVLINATYNASGNQITVNRQSYNSHLLEVRLVATVGSGYPYDVFFNIRSDQFAPNITWTPFDVRANGFSIYNDTTSPGAASSSLVLETGSGAASNIVATNGLYGAYGGGVQFPATQVASANANTLDDYEEGTWTPYLSDGTNTVSFADGYYIKIGRSVSIRFGKYNANISGLTAGAQLTLTGLPFPCAYPGQDVVLIGSITSNNPILLEFNTGGTSGTLYHGANGAGVNGLVKGDFNSTTNGSLWGNFVYLADA